MRLTLPAELALLSFDPATCEPFATERARRRAAFGAAAVHESEPLPGGAWGLRRLGRRAERAALEERGLVAGGRLADRAALAAHWEAVVGLLAVQDFRRERDRALVAVLSWADVLEPRLRGRDPGWFADCMRAAVPFGATPDRAVAALALTRGGDVDAVRLFLIDEAADVFARRRREYPHVQAQDTYGAMHGH